MDVLARHRKACGRTAAASEPALPALNGGSETSQLASEADSDEIQIYRNELSGHDGDSEADPIAFATNSIYNVPTQPSINGQADYSIVHHAAAAAGLGGGGGNGHFNNNAASTTTSSSSSSSSTSTSTTASMSSLPVNSMSDFVSIPRPQSPDPDLLTWERIMKIATGAVKGMIYLHSKGVIHRDFKSPNILVTKDWTAKISDFGGSRNQALQHSSFMTMNHIGTTRWMAPELHEKQPYSQKMDVYSFGIVLWELISGDVPFAGIKWDTEIADRVVRGERPPIPDGCSHSVRDLIEYCWAAEPDIRPSFPEILERLVAIAQELNVNLDEL